MLKFYALYKQATEGPCTKVRPAFYDVVGKAKWDAWNKLGRMRDVDAMESYVDELKKIIEAMPHTEMVAEFVEKLGCFYEIVEERETVSRNGLTEVTAGSRSDNWSPARSNHSGQSESLDAVNSCHSSQSGDDDAESNGEEFCDTYDLPLPCQSGEETLSENHNGLPHSAPINASSAPVPPHTSLLDRTADPSHAPVHTSDNPAYTHRPNQDHCRTVQNLGGPAGRSRSMQGDGQTQNGRPGTRVSATANVVSRPGRGSPVPHSQCGGALDSLHLGRQSLAPLNEDFNGQIVMALARLQQDLDSVLCRLHTLETLTLTQHKIARSRRNSESRIVQVQPAPWWWPFSGVPGRAVLVMLVWPFVVHWLLRMLARRRRHRRT